VGTEAWPQGTRVLYSQSNNKRDCPRRGHQVGKFKESQHGECLSEGERDHQSRTMG